MKFKVNKNYIYLFFVYFSISVFVRFIFNDFIETKTFWQPVIVFSLLLFIVISYERFLKIIQNLSGGRSHSKSYFFGRILELNKKIQNHLEVNIVLKLVKTELEDLLNADNIIIYLNKNIETKDISIDLVKPKNDPVNNMEIWGKGDFHV